MSWQWVLGFYCFSPGKHSNKDPGADLSNVCIRSLPRFPAQNLDMGRPNWVVGTGKPTGTQSFEEGLPTQECLGRPAGICKRLTNLDYNPLRCSEGSRFSLYVVCKLGKSYHRPIGLPKPPRNRSREKRDTQVTCFRFPVGC